MLLRAWPSLRGSRRPPWALGAGVEGGLWGGAPRSQQPLTSFLWVCGCWWDARGSWVTASSWAPLPPASFPRVRHYGHSVPPQTVRGLLPETCPCPSPGRGGYCELSSSLGQGWASPPGPPGSTPQPSELRVCAPRSHPCPRAGEKWREGDRPGPSHHSSFWKRRGFQDSVI